MWEFMRIFPSFIPCTYLKNTKDVEGDSLESSIVELDLSRATLHFWLVARFAAPASLESGRTLNKMVEDSLQKW
jgi:hypothetical protein